MRTGFRLAAFLVLLTGAVGSALAAQADNPVLAAQEKIREAIAAHQAGDLDTQATALEAAAELNPSSLWTRYQLARTYVQRGEAARALPILETLARAGIDYGMRDDEVLATLAGEPRFDALVTLAEERTAARGNSSEFWRLSRQDLVPEGIAHDPGSERLFFGSMRTGEVFVIAADGGVTRFARLEEDGRPLAAIGMRADAERGLLWVVGADFSLTLGHDADTPTRSGAFAFDLASGELRHRVLRTDAGFGFNDLVVAANGDVYLSGYELSVLRAGSERIVPLQVSQSVYASNGICLNADEETLYTAGYPTGLYAVTLATGETRRLEPPADSELYGIDGLYCLDDALLAVQNGAQPWRLMKFSLDASGRRITSARVLEMNNPAFVPTTGTIRDSRLYYIGQGPVPESPPAHIPASLHGNIGDVVIMTAPLD